MHSDQSSLRQLPVLRGKKQRTGKQNYGKSLLLPREGGESGMRQQNLHQNRNQSKITTENFRNWIKRKQAPWI